MLRSGLWALAAAGLSQCAGGPKPSKHTDVVVSVKEQKLAIYNRGGSISKEYPVSTSKFGVGDKPGTYGTPVGFHEVVAKIGHGAPSGAVFKSRHWTGEVIKPDSPGRDPIVSRIMWLRGMEGENKNAYGRCIYIHGTAEEKNIGKPVSYGCIRMKSRDVIDLFNRLPIGSRVLVMQDGLPAHVPELPEAVPVKPEPGTQPPIFLESQKADLAQHTAPESREDADPVNSKKTEVADDAPKKSFLSKATSSVVSLVRRRPSETEAVTESQSAPESVAFTQPEPPPPPKKLPNGGALLYSAPAGSTTPGIVLKSRRSASQGYQN